MNSFWPIEKESCSRYEIFYRDISIDTCSLFGVSSRLGASWCTVWTLLCTWCKHKCVVQLCQVWICALILCELPTPLLEMTVSPVLGRVYWLTVWLFYLIWRFLNICPFIVWHLNPKFGGFTPTQVILSAAVIWSRLCPVMIFLSVVKAILLGSNGASNFTVQSETWLVAFSVWVSRMLFLQNQCFGLLCL